MTRAEPEEPSVFATEVTAERVREGSVLVDSPVGRLALVVDRPSQTAADGSPQKPGEKGTDSGMEKGKIVAIDAWCPHIDGPLWEGSALDGEIACPWHRWRYSLKTGQCTWAPAGDAEEAAETEIAIYAVRERADGCLEIILQPRSGTEPGQE